MGQGQIVKGETRQMKLTGLPLNLKFISTKPWLLLNDLEKIFSKLGKPRISPLAELDKNIKIDGDVWIEDRVRILPFTVIRGPAFFERNSVIGSNVNFGAGVKISNLRFDKGNVFITLPNGKRLNSGRKKLGAIICDNVQLGVNTVTMPGTIIESGSTVMLG